jgi:16S rRNA (uracil1498-N3)-methyltransferase
MSIRLFVDQPIKKKQFIHLSENQRHYLRDVMRVQYKDFIEIFDGKNGQWKAEIVELSKKDGKVNPLQKTKEQNHVPAIDLLFSPIKSARMEFMLEKACELGVREIFPIICQRTIVRKFNHDKARLNLIEAAEQTGRLSIPVLHELQELPKAILGRENLIFCDETGGEGITEVLREFSSSCHPSVGWDPDNNKLDSSIRWNDNLPCSILIGPEGGFSEEERRYLLSLPNVRGTSLGENILRADTAAIAALALAVNLLA